MIFTSFEFIAFFAAVMVLRLTLPSLQAEKWLLLVASYIFYGSWNPAYLLLLVGVSLLDYLVGRGLAKTEGVTRRRWLLAVSIAGNLGLIAYFKYTNFFLDNVEAGLHALGFSVDCPNYSILLPVGVSFFTFQSMSYTIDVYRGHLHPCRNLRDFLLFVSFFPQLVAGPIVRAADYLPQLHKRMRATLEEFESGLALFGLGVIKKAVISDQISAHVDEIFAAPGQYDGATLLCGLIGYTIQIYCDFSGYSDMAIGAARMMGYRFMENFRMPYGAASVTEFWRRWHISLSAWLRDYLYIPLGGNRRGPVRTYWNLLVTMLLGGLWHGASWNFVIWGGIHGGALCVHKLWRDRHPVAAFPESTAWSACTKVLAHLATLSVVLLGWIFFRAQGFSLAWTYLTRLVTWQDSGTRLLSPQILTAAAGVLVAHFAFARNPDWVEHLSPKPVLLRALVYSAVLALIACFAASEAAPFIYFQF